MLLIHVVFAAVLLPLAISADLTCLKWGLISPLAGIICCFEPETFQTVQQETVATVKDAVASAKNLVDFDLTHNPIAITYNFVEKSKADGLGSGESYLYNVTTDFRDVTVGFGEESANQIVQIFELTHWSDVSLCLIEKAREEALISRQRLLKRAGRMTMGDGMAIAKKCVGDKYSSLSKPVIFNVTGSNQIIGSTISNVAGMLIPVGPEGEAVTTFANGAVDLAIPGSEESTRVFKLVEGKGEHFSTTEEAQATASKMQDPAWLAEKCKICNAPPIGPAEVNKQRLKRWNLSSACCPAALAVVLPDIATSGMTYDELESAMAQQGLISNSEDSLADSDGEFSASTQTQENRPIFYVAEDDLVPSIPYELRQIDGLTSDIQGIKSDLDEYSTSLLQWDSQLRSQSLSPHLFTVLRHAFENSQGNSLLAQLLQVQDYREWTSYDLLRPRRVIYGRALERSHDSRLLSVREFIRAAKDQCKGVVAKLKNLSRAQERQLRAEIKFLYDPPYAPPAESFDTLRMSEDFSVMRFTTSDATGTVIQSQQDGRLSSLPSQPTSFYLLKGQKWHSETFRAEDENVATRFTEFGHVAAQRGCVHMSISVFMS